MFAEFTPCQQSEFPAIVTIYLAPILYVTEVTHTSFSIITLYFISILWKEPPDHAESSNAWNSFTTPYPAFFKAQPKMRTSVNHPRGINFSHSNILQGLSVVMSIFITFSAVSNSSSGLQLTNCMCTKKVFF